MASGTIQRQKQIQSGSLTSGSIPASNYVDFTVTFDTPFAGIPTVVATISTNTSYQDRAIYFSRITPSKSDVVFRIYNPYTAATELNASRKVDWIAVY